jgi:hypothetical protein
LEEVSPSSCKGGSEEVRSPMIFNLAQIYPAKDSIWVERSCFRVSIFSFMMEQFFFINGGNIGTDLLHFLLGLCEIKVKGIEVGFKVFSTGVAHDEGGNQRGASGTTQKKCYG